MNYDNYGVVFSSESELCDLLYINPTLDLTKFLVIDPEKYNQAIKLFHLDLNNLEKYVVSQHNLTDFDSKNQSQWYMPDEYKKLDIVQWLLDKCNNQTELQRVAQELFLFEERDLFDLLRYLKYFVDTMRKNKVVWGLGRGSSVASYILYLIGVHKINSIYYDLDITEFLKSE